MFTRIIQRIEEQQYLHKLLLRIWRLFPPRLAGFLKGMLARNWVLGAVAVIIDDSVCPAQILLAEHSYRRRGAWGLPGGALDTIPGDPTHPRDDASPDDVLEATLQKEVLEELGIRVDTIRLLRTDAVPYIAEEPGPYRLTFYFLCTPAGGFAVFRERLENGEISAHSPEISRMKMVPMDRLDDYDLFSPDGRLLRNDLSRLLPNLDTGTH